ncbi:hypothetical protein C8N36_109169 [Pelagimonas varians]|uniref:Uncharacterized protein n=1 Tax=Pelagimonas varians TaxID=696760 RepID=A0A238KK39_9RHOB|nr:hypothetical protein C8N36_109169 [Pelagimonas varians]SMX43143.1 hypothetical protein PEV8663_02598 [Pelagimonas varians]
MKHFDIQGLSRVPGSGASGGSLSGKMKHGRGAFGTAEV